MVILFYTDTYQSVMFLLFYWTFFSAALLIHAFPSIQRCHFPPLGLSLFRDCHCADHHVHLDALSEARLPHLSRSGGGTGAFTDLPRALWCWESKCLVCGGEFMCENYISCQSSGEGKKSLIYKCLVIQCIYAAC